MENTREQTPLHPSAVLARSDAHRLENLRKQAKELLAQFCAGDEPAVERFRAYHPNFPKDRICLADAQSVIAREQGYPSWPKMKASLQRAMTARQYAATGPVEWKTYVSFAPLTIHGTPFYGVRDRFFGFSPVVRVHWGITNLTDGPVYLEINYRSPRPNGPGKWAFSVGYALGPRETRSIHDILPVVSAHTPSVFRPYLEELRIPGKRFAASHYGVSTDPLAVSRTPERSPAVAEDNSQLALASVVPVWSETDGNVLEVTVDNRSGVEKRIGVEVAVGHAGKADGDKHSITMSDGSFAEAYATPKPNQETVLRVPYSVPSDAALAPMLVFRLFEPVQRPADVLQSLGLTDQNGYHNRDTELIYAGSVDLAQAAANGDAVLPEYVPVEQRAELTAESRSEHFLFRYRPDSCAARNIDSIVRNREAAYEKLKDMLDMDVPVAITVDLYPDMEAKGFGSGTTWTPANTVTDEHIAEVYSETYQCGDFHELAHIFTFQFGGSVEGLCEPFADYCGSGGDITRYVELVKPRLKGGEAASLPQAASSYREESLLLIDYLLSRDLAAFKRFYVATTRGEDLERAAYEAYGVDLQQLEQQLREHLAAL